MFRLGAKQVYDDVIESLGAKGVSAGKQLALQHGVQGGLAYIENYTAWTWRRRRKDVFFTASSPYFEMPEDYESMAETEISRTDPTDSVFRTITPQTNRDFWRNRPQDTTGVPAYYRIVPSSHTQNTNSSWWYVMETAPRPNTTYKWPEVEYFRATEELSFTGSTGTVPDMPTEFFDTWVLASEWRGAKALGRHKLARLLKADLDDALSTAAERHDRTFPDSSPGGVEDAYGDINAVP